MRPVYPFGFRDVKKATYYFDIGTFYYPITPEKSCNNEMVKSSFFKKSFFAPCFKFRWEWSNGDFKN